MLSSDDFDGFRSFILRRDVVQELSRKPSCLDRDAEPVDGSQRLELTLRRDGSLTIEKLLSGCGGEPYVTLEAWVGKFQRMGPM